MPPKKKRAGKKKPKPKIILPDIIEDKTPQDFGDYKLGTQLGRGAFGSVYQGLDTSTGQLVAIKTIPLNQGQSLEGVQAEITMMSGLNNEHIVKYIGSHKTDDFLYIVMEYAEGGSLQHIQKKFTNFNEQLAAQYIHQVLLGLQYLHSQSIIHRDIKAANILLNNNIAKLSDFGISVNLNEGPRADADFQCSPYWAAPEVINMESITEKCDIWSLGITAIEMFTGQPPFFDLAPIPAMFKIVQSQETPLPENISPEFKDFLLGCLKRDVTFRKSTEELLNHVWITRKNLNKATNAADESSDDSLFGSDSEKSDVFASKPSLSLKPAKSGSNAIDAFAESSDDDMDFDGGLSFTPKNSNTQLPGMKALDMLNDLDFDDMKPQIKKKEEPKDIEDFMEDEESSDDFGEAFTGTTSSLKFAPLSRPKLAPSIPLKPLGDIDDDSDESSDDIFESDDNNSNNNNKLTFAFVDPKANMSKLDEMFADEEDADQREQERQNRVMKNTIDLMEKLLSDEYLNNNSDATHTFIEESCKALLNNFNTEPSLKTNLTDYHGVIPIVEIIQTQNQFLLENALPFIIVASKDQTDTQNMLCLLGVLPYLFEYCISRDYSANIQEMSLKILHSFCTSKKKPLQMFISAGGLPKMAKILEVYPHKERPILTKLVIEIVDAVFSFHCSTPKSCFARIMAQSNIIALLGKRFVDISKDDPSMKALCDIFEVFSNADTQVKLKMADKQFINDIFTKASYKWRTKTSKPTKRISPSANRRLTTKNKPVKLTETTANKSNSNTNNKSNDKSHNKSNDKSHNKSNDKSHSKSNPNSVSKSGEKLVDKSVGQSKEKSDVNQKVKSTLPAPQQEEDTTSGLNDFDLLTIMRMLNNLAMDKSVVQVLWNTKLVDNLLEYLRVERHPQMNPMLNTCFSALFHLSRVLSSENVPKIAPLIPMLVYIITNDLQLKELATTLFLEFINTHSSDRNMRMRLENNNGIETLFYLLEKNPHKDQIISQIANWASSQNLSIEDALIRRCDKFADIVGNVFKKDQISVQTAVADKLLQICDKCPHFVKALAKTPLINIIVNKLTSNAIDGTPELRKSFLSMIIVFYQSSDSPKKLIVDCRLDRVGRRLIHDSSLPVKNLAIQLMQSVASNYIF
ncbi:hypothetical protein TRFO_24218 [Tritrichomonas foetus]|uniref:non-specific serine/threonine protein kinase n=1 Tax=Tritrichomonas foetus TaxID=1144522 RepID=A0A1J4K9B3_9EUKA|nr:hypothetical protein TRFO_24218 [Tritrichomonas foetus]|eukprot:OHT07488.1 hypothetical protein TRFO_24218 [Tritrichomonas foetus]